MAGVLSPQQAQSRRVLFFSISVAATKEAQRALLLRLHSSFGVNKHATKEISSTRTLETSDPDLVFPRVLPQESPCRLPVLAVILPLPEFHGMRRGFLAAIPLSPLRLVPADVGPQPAATSQANPAAFHGSIWATNASHLLHKTWTFDGPESCALVCLELLHPSARDYTTPPKVGIVPDLHTASRYYFLERHFDSRRVKTGLRDSHGDQDSTRRRRRSQTTVQFASK